MEIISPIIKGMHGIHFVSEELGKKVYSKSGAVGGKVKDVIAHNKHILAIIVKDMVIDEHYIHSSSKGAIMLNIDPVFEFIGKEVFDADGAHLGKVVSIEKDGITAKVKVEIRAPAVVTAVITKEAVEDLSIKVGDEVNAVVKSTEVMIAK